MATKNAAAAPSVSFTLPGMIAGRFGNAPEPVDISFYGNGYTMTRYNVVTPKKDSAGNNIVLPQTVKFVKVDWTANAATATLATLPQYAAPAKSAATPADTLLTVTHPTFGQTRVSPSRFVTLKVQGWTLADQQ